MKSPIIYVIALVALLLLGVGAYFYFNSNGGTSFSCTASPTKPVIAAFGDSLVAGYGAPEQQGFVGPLSTQLGVTIINDGESGDTTAQALLRLPNLIAQHANIVIVLIGGNDALQRIPLATTKANIDSIISAIQASGSNVVLVGVLGGIVSDPFKPMFADLARTYDVPYVPNILDGLIGNSKYMYDEVHPNATGYDRFATKLFPTINDACRKFVGK